MREKKWLLLFFLARTGCSCLYYWKNWVIRSYRMLPKERYLAGTSHSVCAGCGIMQPLCRSGPLAKAGSRTRDKRLQGQKQGTSKRNWLFKQRCGEAEFRLGEDFQSLSWNNCRDKGINEWLALLIVRSGMRSSKSYSRGLFCNEIASFLL